MYSAPVCRTGGKPSTWFPPGGCRVEHAMSTQGAAKEENRRERKEKREERRAKREATREKREEGREKREETRDKREERREKREEANFNKNEEKRRALGFFIFLKNK